MDETVSAAEADRSFSRLLRTVRETGKAVTVTSDGKPVARLIPLEDDTEAEKARRAEAWKKLMERLETVRAVDGGSWTRDELYERVPWTKDDHDGR